MTLCGYGRSAILRDNGCVEKIAWPPRTANQEVRDDDELPNGRVHLGPEKIVEQHDVLGCEVRLPALEVFNDSRVRMQPVYEQEANGSLCQLRAVSMEVALW